MSGILGEEGQAVNVTRRLLTYLYPYRWQVAVALTMTLGVSAMELLGPYLFHIGIDRYIVPSVSGSLPGTAATWGLAVVVVFFLGVELGDFILQYMQVRIMQQVGQGIMLGLRKETFEHLQKLPMSFFDRNPVGLLVTRVTTDVDAVNDLFASGIVAMLNDFVLLLGMAVILLKWHPLLGLATLSPLPCMVLLSFLFQNRARSANRQIRTAITRMNAFLHEYISGITVVQLFNRRRRAGRDFTTLNRTHLEACQNAIDAFSFFYPTVEFLAMAGLALLYWVGGMQVLTGAVEIGVLMSFVMYAERFFRPIQDLSEKLEIVQGAVAASEKIFEVLDEPAAKDDCAAAPTSAAARGEIEFRNVWFAYESGAHGDEANWVLRDVSFRVEPGQTLAIVGRTGAGKTTLIQLLLRFYDIQRGQILLDGVDIRDMDVRELRRLFGIVLQDPFLFTGTLESNVKLGSGHIERATAEKALRKVGLGPLLDSYSGGIEMPVTERGSTMSVGQRQLVSFARALAHNSKFLILDEATASVDTRTELMIREALDQLLEGRTAVVIAHRLSTIQHADQILVFHKGRLREQGTHQQLLFQRGIYYRLYQLQYKEEEIRVPLLGSAAAESHHLA